MSDEQEAEMADEEVDAEDEVEETETEEETGTAEGGLQEGDFVRLAYTARTVEDERLVDTTDQEVAEEEGVDQEDREFEPRVIVLGAGHVFPEVEEDIYGKEVGDSGSVTIPAEDAFGLVDENEIRTVSAEKIPEDDRFPGGHVDIDGQHGHVETIIGGRARVDFNHPLAGSDIEYEYEVVGEVEDKLERASGLLSMYFDVPDLDMRIETDEVEEEVQVESDDDGEDAEPEFETQTVEKETLYIESTPQLTMNQQWMFQKQQIGQELIDRLEIDRIVVEDVIDGTGGMMGGMGGMMGGMGGGDVDLEEALEDADIDEDELVDELEAEGEIDESEDVEAESDDE